MSRFFVCIISYRRGGLALTSLDGLSRVTSYMANISTSSGRRGFIEPSWRKMAWLNFSKRSDFEQFLIPDSYQGAVRNKDDALLKVYQDLYLYTFVTRYVRPGARILEVGGGLSRLAGLFADKYEYWLLDKFEGAGNGPKIQPQSEDIKIVHGFIGEYSPQLPETYFDCVISVSVWEHFPQDRTVLDDILLDIDRILSWEGVSVHCMDFVLADGQSPQDLFVEHLKRNIYLIAPVPDVRALAVDPNLYVLSKHAYDQTWMPITKQSYASFGRPASFNFAYTKSQSRRHRKNLPRLSVVTVTKNDFDALQETIASVATQGYENLEHVIIDGDSSDNTIPFLKQHNGNIDCWVSEPDGGIYDAMNKGTRLASGEWLIFLNAGDTFYAADVVERVFAEPYGDAELIYGDTEIIKQDGSAVIVGARPIDTFWKQINFNHNALFCRRSLLLDHPFDLHYRIVADSEFIGRCIQEGRKFHHARFAINRYQLGGYSDIRSVQRSVERWKLMLDQALADDKDIHIHYTNRILEDPQFEEFLADAERHEGAAPTRGAFANMHRLLKSKSEA